MNDTQQYRYNFESLDLIGFVKTHFLKIVLICFIGAVISSVAALLITDKYKSTVILFPTPSTSVSKALLSDNVSAKAVSTFGDEEEVERLLQILKSDEIRQKIIEKYDLMTHYEVDPDSKYKYNTLSRIYNGNVSADRTKFMSIKIEVIDKDPNMAANIANDIAAYIDTTMNRMQKQRSQMALKVVETEYLDLQNQIRVLEDSLHVLRDLGIYDYESQAEVYSDAYAQALSKGLVNHVKLLEEKLRILAKYGGSYISIRDYLVHEKKHLSEVKAKYVEARVDAEQNLPNKYIVNNARPAERKSYPIRWLIVLVSTICVFFLTVLSLIFIEVFLKKANN